MEKTKSCVRCSEYRPGLPINEIPSKDRTRICQECAEIILDKLDRLDQ